MYAWLRAREPELVAQAKKVQARRAQQQADAAPAAG
jgi:hypothetical protein